MNCDHKDCTEKVKIKVTLRDAEGMKPIWYFCELHAWDVKALQERGFLYDTEVIDDSRQNKPYVSKNCKVAEGS